MNLMHQNNIWTLVNLPPRRKAIGNKWILKIKLKVDDIVERYKVRLVAKGYAQQEGIDYEETFSPIVRFSPIYNILAIAVHLDLELHQMKVKTTFLNGELTRKFTCDNHHVLLLKAKSKKCANSKIQYMT